MRLQLERNNESKAYDKHNNHRFRPHLTTSRVIIYTADVIEKNNQKRWKKY